MDELESCSLLEQVGLDFPLRREEHVVIVALVKAVLQNAPHLHVRQGEGLDLIMFLLATLFSPDHDSVERLSGKGDDRAIAMNRSPAQVVDGEVPAAIWNLDVRVSSSRLGEYLDPHIHGFMG